MFQYAKAPKEGRLPPSGLLNYGAGSKAIRSQRHGTIALIGLLCFFAWFFFLRADPATSARQPTSSLSHPHVPARTSAQEANQHNSDGLGNHNGQGVGQHVVAGQDEAESENDVDIADGDLHSKPKGSDGALKASKEVYTGVEKWEPRPSFERALQKVLDMMPDEVNMRELIRPIDTGGKERMRELGLRTRQYKKYLNAWEKLHLVEDSTGEVSVRDDVIQYLHSGLIGTSGSSNPDEPSIANTPLAVTIGTYEAFRTFLAKFAQSLFPFTAPYFADHMSLHAHFKKGGRGIVLTAGDDQAPYLMTGIHMLRKLGCNLPIEVHYLGDSDLGEDYRADLEALPGVVTRDVSRMIFDDGWRLAGWAAKPFAILVSSFREVIFIDADSLFFKNPEILFEDPGYKETGALFFRDRLIMPESKKRFLQQLLPKPISKQAKQSRFWTGDSGHQQESGVVVVDKWKHFIALLLICRFNGSDRDTREGKTGVYELMYGDKETFWIGFLLAGDEGFSFHKGDCAGMGVPKPREKAEKPEGENESEPVPETPDSYELCAPQLLHLDTEGKPLWFNGWIMDNKFAEKGKRNFAIFESYLIEPKEVREPTQWQLKENNLCCLTSDADKHFPFSPEDMQTLNTIVEHAKSVGMAA